MQSIRTHRSNRGLILVRGCRKAALFCDRWQRPYTGSMPTANHASLHETLAEQEQQIAVLTRQLAVKKQESVITRGQLTVLHTHVQTLNTLSQGLFSLLDANEIYQLVCRSVVHQLDWDSAFVIDLQPNDTTVLAYYQVTEGQVRHVTGFAHKTPHLVQAYARHEVINTFISQNTAALALRVLFQTDEVVAVPLSLEENSFGYLVACAHGTARPKRTEQDFHFLSLIATLTAHAVQSSTTVTSLEKQNTKLHELDELKNSFISITSHQLRTPLSIVKWILSILEGDPTLTGPAFEKQRTLISQAYQSNERLIHVVNDLLNVSRIENGRLPYNPQLVNVRELLQEIVHGAADTCASKSLNLDVELDPDLPTVKVDPILFREAFRDLLDNAIDYNKEGGFVKLEACVGEDEYTVKVSNSGMGIQPADVRKVFTQFYRAPEAIRQYPNGNGLGLYLTRAIIEEHGGHIFCQSEPGVKTTFTVSFPLR